MSHRNSLSLRLLLGASPVVAGLLLSQACANRAEDCYYTSDCPIEGGTANAGTAGQGASGSGATTGGSGSGDAGNNSTGGTPMTGGSGATAGDGGSSLGGEGGTPSQPCDGACTAPTPVCKEATDTCVECLGPTDCAAGDENLCDTTSNTCVECLAPADCDMAIASRCDAGACVACEDNNDCAHIAGKGVCDTTAGECVQCTTADEAACAGKSCNPATNACTDTNVGSVGTCKPCLADSECTGGDQADPDARCVPMEFNGTPRQGGFCLRRVAKTCAKPFQIPISASSLSGAASESYCGIDQENVRCEAVLDLDMECSTGEDTLCGCARDQEGACTETGSGGLCRTVGVNANRCTYSCGAPSQCPNGTVCTVDDPYCH